MKSEMQILHFNLVGQIEPTVYTSNQRWLDHRSFPLFAQLQKLTAICIIFSPSPYRQKQRWNVRPQLESYYHGYHPSHDNYWPHLMLVLHVSTCTPTITATT